MTRIFVFEVAPRLKFVLLIPDMEVLTEDARKVLPPTIGHREAVTNIGNTAMISARRVNIFLNSTSHV